MGAGPNFPSPRAETGALPGETRWEDVVGVTVALLPAAAARRLRIRGKGTVRPASPGVPSCPSVFLSGDGGGRPEGEQALGLGAEMSLSDFSFVIAILEEGVAAGCVMLELVSAWRSHAVARVTVCCPLQIPMFTQGWPCSSRTH